MSPDNLWTFWEFDPGVVISLALAGILYWRGSRLSRGVTRREQICFWAGMGVLIVSLISPLHPLGEQLFSAHMAQHELLMIVAAPLFVLARPAVPMLFGVPLQWRRIAGGLFKAPAARSVWRTLTRPVNAWLIHAAAIWGWHAPALFEAGIRSDLIHTLQHCSFFFSALLFWWSLTFRESYGAAVLSVFTTSLHTSILGAILTLSPTVWYSPYLKTAPLWGLTALEDQQTGGLIMWIPAGIVYIAAALCLMALWIRESDLMAERRRRYAS
ncbi:MAG TPA: cytochrome c oxidase assembly protein [Bryobacteraceae bacterium]|nr:cytochrome c oxidase assembly protein [Bryobacteraceae bacterium]